jgi:SAM-dependent methyltransferase
MTVQPTGFPSSADAWLVPSPCRVLTIGRASASASARLHSAGCEVTLVEKDATALAALSSKLAGVAVLAGSADALPLRPASFDVVLITQGLHLLAPGLALAEFARVLVPGGRLALSYTTRDDSVPWVRRLAGVLQSYDAELMTGRQVDSISALDGSSYFPEVEHRSFRMWVPISRDGMLAMVRRSPTLAALPRQQSAHLEALVAAVYDSSARHPEPLLLPYAVQCWRADVCQDEFTTRFTEADGLRITL